jgi:hypothetical protein
MIVHARLDPETEALLVRLRRRLGESDSEILRKAIRHLARGTQPTRGPRIIGLGKFASGIEDLGSNERHLEGFGSSGR